MPYCLCDAGYSHGPEGKTACLLPQTSPDPWGLMWDEVERIPATHREAAATCASLGGRLPSLTELHRNNHVDGKRGVGDAKSTHFIWSSAIASAQSEDTPVLVHTYSLAHAERGNEYWTQTAAYRCVWDLTPRPDRMASVNCHSQEPRDECLYVTLNKVRYTVDLIDRVPQSHEAAAQECRRMGARLPTSLELMRFRGIPNITDQYLWTNTFIGQGFLQHRLGTTGVSGVAGTRVADRTDVGAFRCLSEQLADGDIQFPSIHAHGENAFEVDPLLRMDRVPMPEATWQDANDNCLKRGGHLAWMDEMTSAVRQGLASDPALRTRRYWTQDAFWEEGKVGFVTVTWPSPTFDPPYADLVRAQGNATEQFPYFCAYRPRREMKTSLLAYLNNESGTESETYQKVTSDGVTHYMLSANAPVANSLTRAIDAAASKGLFLPTLGEQIFMIRSQLPNGVLGQPLTTISLADYNNTTIQSDYHAVAFEGDGEGDFTTDWNHRTSTKNNTATYCRYYINTTIH